MINLMQGDCLERMKEIESGSVDMILTDPPYGTTACKWDSIIPLEPMWEQLKRIIKPNCAIVMTASQPFTSVLVSSNIKQFKHEWIWRKNAGSNFGALKYQPMKEHESIIVFCGSRVNYYPIKQERAESGKAMIMAGVKSKASKGLDVYGGLNQGYDNSNNDKNMRVPSSVQLFNRERGLHPTQKPVALMEYLIKTYTNEGETVLDFTMGSGTTGVAAKNLNRNFIGIELDEGYFEIAKERIDKA
ncbi:DNA methylase [Vibrio phage pYD38-B]|uniref:DNA methylase n=1 Tax=Vibrio phage pYD38-B TaxID=929835 RepID=UPI0003425CEB|nr:DNA methylase [Vibrio phage pYD38-B]AGN34374.1 DNA methylase [Vibrio phage pYD38-B]